MDSPAGNYVPLRVHSHHSLLRGTATVADLCRAAASRGCEALALTDTNSVGGAVSFWEEAQAAGLRPILGAEICPANEPPATLLVRNPDGWRRLNHILTDRLGNPSFSLAMALREDRAGLVVLASDPGLLAHLARASGCQSLYVALPRHGPRQGLLAFARGSGLPAVAAPPVFFVDPQDHPLHRLLRAIDLNTRLSRLPASQVAPPLSWLMSPTEIQKAFVDCPEAVARPARLARDCALSRPPWGEAVFPRFRHLSDEKALAELRRKCETGMARRYTRITHAHRRRLEHELALVAAKGFAGYFLVVHDIVSRWPHTCGRGSAAASLIAYALGITHVDPVRHDLFFERFLNAGRRDPPDIDVDFAWDERDQVLDALFARYGRQRAAMVCTRICFRGRAAVRETAKVFGLPAAEITTLTRRLARTWHHGSIRELMRSHPLFQDLDLQSPWPEIINWAARLEGIPRHLSVHPGGVIIVPSNVADHVAMQPSAKGVNIIQWDKDAAEDAGLVKIDLLGNRSLAVIRDALAAVKTNQGIDIPYPEFNPLEDRRTQDLLARGDTVGVFYVESPAMRQLQSKTGHGDFEHLVIHSSIIRPAANAYIREYVRRLHGGRYQSLHPLMDRLMPRTYGIMVYQEDVARVAMAMAGLDAASADGLRKTLARKDRSRRLRDQRHRFHAGALERGYRPEVVDAVWQMILSFAGYSFCKPHSASYALVSFKSAYLKAHYPAEFMAGVLTNRGGYYSTFAYISECRRMGLQVLLPDVNRSHIPYRGHHRRLRIGLMQIRGLTEATREALVHERRHGAYRSCEDLLRRLDPDPADIRLLIRAGACDSIACGRTRPQLAWQALEWEQGRRGRGGRTSDLHRCGSDLPLLPIFDTPLAPVPDAPQPDQATILRHEVDTLGFLASRHPLTLYGRQIAQVPTVRACDLSRHVGRTVHTVGWYVTGKVVNTRNHEQMEFISFEDTSALYETTFFPDVYRRFCTMLTHTRPYLLRGRVQAEFGAVTLTVEEMRFLDQVPGSAAARFKRRGHPELRRRG
ncbi:MAG: DNA polymerase III subunit alpha [Acidobacteria bacterium]|nr:DNA polymerase III subunit alpha [Acidobacteriota bacterium]